MNITVTINGETYERDVDPRRLLIHFIRDDLDLTGSHVGCDTGNCGACTVLYNGDAVKSCMLLAVQADGATIETVESLSANGELDALQQAFSDHHALQCGYCTPGMLMSAKHLLDHNAEPDGRRDPQGDPGQHLPLHRLREHRRGDQGGVQVTEPLVVEKTETKAGFIGVSTPRKEDKRLLQGEGTFFDDVKRHGMGYVHFVRAPYAHANITAIDVSKAAELEGVYGTLIGEEVAALTDPFFELSTPPGADMKDYALAVGKVRHMGEPVAAVVASSRELARDAAELVEVELRAAAHAGRCRKGAGRGRSDPPRGGGLERRLVRPLRLGRLRRGARGGRPRRPYRAPALRPLLVDAARVRRLRRRVRPRHAAVVDLR